LDAPVVGCDEPAPSNEIYFDVRTSSARTSQRGITLSDQAIAWNASGTGYRRDFDQIVTVELETIDGAEELVARCDIGFSIDPALTVVIADPSDTEIVTFRDFVHALIGRLSTGQRARIAFRHGSRPQTRVTAMIIGSLGVALLLFVIAYAVGELKLYLEVGWWLVLPVLVFGVVMCGRWVRQAHGDGMRPFDPVAIPPEALPLTAREQRAARRGRRV
jgi:hypothetical protein